MVSLSDSGVCLQLKKKTRVKSEKRFGQSKKVSSKLLHIQIISFLSILFPLWFPASSVSFTSSLTLPMKGMIPAFFFFLHRLLPFPLYTHPCLLFKASLPVILLIYFHVFNLASSLNSCPDLGNLEFSNCKAAQAIFH